MAKTSGSWPKGKSGNPGGRGKGTEAREKLAREMFGDDVPKMLAVFRDLGLGLTTTGYQDIQTSDRIKAGQEVLDRVLGRAKQAIEGEVSIGLSPGDSALLAALHLTPHERRNRIAELSDDDSSTGELVDEVE